MIGGLLNLLLDGLIVAFGQLAQRLRPLWSSHPRPYMCDECALCEARGVCSNPCQCSRGVNAFGDGLYPSGQPTDIVEPEPLPRHCLCGHFESPHHDVLGCNHPGCAGRKCVTFELCDCKDSDPTDELATLTEDLGLYEGPVGEQIDPACLAAHPLYARIQDEFHQK